MRFFTGQYERSIDAKNRIQIPAQLRGGIEAGGENGGIYITLGEQPGTLSIFTERGFEELAARIETEFMDTEESRAFERQFFSTASYVEPDKQGRMVLPERLVKKAGLEGEIFLVGQKSRIDIWNRDQFETEQGIDWDGSDWPDWKGFLRMRPAGSKPESS